MQKQLNALMGAMIAFSLILVLPAVAVDESVTTTLYFTIATADELSVTLLGDSAVTSTGGGTATTNNIAFNFTALTQNWVNATRTGTPTPEQNTTDPILKLDNTGTTNLNIQMNVTATLVGSCFALRYNATTYIGNENEPEYNATDLDTTPVTINSSYAPDEPELSVWLWANATACTNEADSTTRTLTIWAIRV